ncbi:MAG TPA: beta-Ala-His dipeptidase [Candidatus Enterocloster faecavium]|uniref:Beta-Ala-His dipeptidase n=1 Tax=Candidatus Enterocloster faecavium TaxID=2838560 RepID=A0A9D2L7Q0_9FIRM|nr:beta-Ala-His dipeptidase [Candidatus Enterocloster faecavium]
MEGEYLINDREPIEIYHFFEDISRIPRVSYHEKEISQYLVDFAEKRGLWYYRDEMYNVLIKKEGSKGDEDKAPVLLEGHVDMVGEKIPGSAHDFLKDPIHLIVDGNILRADGTTLGADNGCAVAIMLAVLADDSLKHPPLECLFTVQEEVGLYGAEGFDVNHIKARRVIGLDAGAEGVFRKGTTTKYLTESALEVKREQISGKVYRFYADGLKGGDQGAGMPKERISAIQMTARILHYLNKEADARIISVDKTGKSIPENCECYFCLVSGNENQMMDIIRKQEKTIRQQYRESDPGFKVEIEEIIYLDKSRKFSGMLQKQDSDCLIKALYLMPYGGYHRSVKRPEEVMLSVMAREIRSEEEAIEVFTRISAEEKVGGQELQEQLSTYLKSSGFKIIRSEVEEGWEWEEHSAIRDIMVQAYEEIFGRKPIVNISPGGNDCVVLKRKIPELDMVTTAATYVDYHTPNEHLYMDSFEKVYKLIVKTLEMLAEN